MTTTVANPTEKMTGQEIVDLTRQHTLFEWSAQSKVDPIPVARSKGIYFWTPEGKRFVDFNSQLMCVNIGDIDVFFFTNGGAEANENAIKLARWATGRQKILARYRSYHGATGAAITLT